MMKKIKAKDLQPGQAFIYKKMAFKAVNVEEKAVDVTPAGDHGPIRVLNPKEKVFAFD